jgi:hypothetical protein
MLFQPAISSEKIPPRAFVCERGREFQTAIGSEKDFEFDVVGDLDEVSPRVVTRKRN